MRLRGIQDYNRSKLYHDRLSIDTKNNYIRNFLPRYSKYQEDINDELDSIRGGSNRAVQSRKITITKTHTKETKDGTFTTQDNLSQDPQN